MPDYMILRFIEQTRAEAAAPAREIGALRVPGFRGPDLHHFLLHLRRIILRHNLRPVSWQGGVRHDPKNTSGMTGSGDVWDLVIALAPEPGLEDAGGMESVLVDAVLPDVYQRFIPSAAPTAPVSEERARRSAVARLEHEDRWPRQEVQDLGVSRQAYGDYVFRFKHVSTGATAFVPVSPDGQALGCLRSPAVG
jgi:hypothetical protein